MGNGRGVEDLHFSGQSDSQPHTLYSGYLTRIVNTSETMFKRLHEKGIDFVAQMYEVLNTVENRDYAVSVGIVTLIPDPGEAWLVFDPKVVDKIHTQIHEELKGEKGGFKDSDLIRFDNPNNEGYVANVYRPKRGSEDITITKKTLLYPFEHISSVNLDLDKEEDTSLWNIVLQLNDRLNTHKGYDPVENRIQELEKENERLRQLIQGKDAQTID